MDIFGELSVNRLGEYHVYKHIKDHDHDLSNDGCPEELKSHPEILGEVIPRKGKGKRFHERDAFYIS